tara:strand:- start:22833 stop:27851 length:5019 start_codon:yes stop_codon:yes gene_type:complete
MSTITTNTVSTSGAAEGYYNTQEYGIDVASSNTYYNRIFGTSEIKIFNSTGAGVFSGIFPNGETGFFTSRTIAKTIDLVSEGEIEGIVSGEWIPSGTNPNGQVGWEYVNFQPFSDTQPEAWLKSIYLNDTPVVNANDQYNFQNVEVSVANGSPSGVASSDGFLYVGDTNAIEKTRVINERLRGPDNSNWDAEGASTDNPFFYHPKVYRFLDKNADRVRLGIKIASLSYTKQGENFDMSEWGEVNGSEVSFAIRYRPIYIDINGVMDLSTARSWYPGNGPLTTTVQGLVQNPYIHPVNITFDSDLMSESLAGWEIEIIRTTVDSAVSNISNQTFIDTITTISKDILSYPNSSLVSMNFNSEYFSQIPTRSFDMRLLKVKVPSNYDPITRQYADTVTPWDGTFKDEKAWTDNPAWIFYDLITNERYGVGRFLNEVEVDKWTLYEISKFCDTLVPNGEGGKEPRFTCNTLINTREDAFKVLKDFASCFRSIIYYGFGSVHTSIDKPRTTVAQFTNANVKDGNFTYSSTSEKATPTVCIVRYNDKTNFYKPALEYVENTEGIRKHGVIEKEVTAFACTSRSQAIRLARWILATDAVQNEIVQYTTGPEGMLLRPGDIVKIVDENRSITKWGGRVVDVNTTGIFLDENLQLDDNTNYQLTLTTPNYFYDTSLVNITSQEYYPDIRNEHIQTFNFSPSNNLVTVSSEEVGHSELIGGPTSGTTITYGDGNVMFSAASGELMKEATWSITDINTQNLYSITSISEEDNIMHKVEAIVHSETKYDYIESGIIYSFVPSPQTVTEAPPAPQGVELYIRNYPGSTNTKRLGIKIHPPSDTGTTIGYKIYIKEGDDLGLAGNWTDADFKEGGISIPKNTYLEQTIYLDDLTDGSGRPYTFYLPPRNNKRYFVRVFAINSVGVMSAAFTDGQDYSGYPGYAITDHFPVKDIKIHSLRLYSEYHPTSSNTESSAQKTYYAEIQDQDFAFVWAADFFGQTVGASAGGTNVSVTFPIEYVIRVHHPNTGSNTPLGTIETYTTQENFFNFSFLLNSSTTNGPHRHVDITVEARSLTDNATSSNGFSSSAKGWDIIEVYNPKPTNYCLTPKKQQGSRPGKDFACDLLNTTQWIDKDGLVHLELLRNSFTDLAGGFIYVSKHPFSGADFNSNGTPKLPSQRGIFNFTSDELHKTGEYQIVECPFEAAGTNTLDSEIIVSPPYAEGSTDPFLFSDTYYMGVKFYDSFDRAIKNKTSNTTWKNDLWLGLARDHTGEAGEVLSAEYQMSENVKGHFVGNYEAGNPRCCNTTLSNPHSFDYDYYNGTYAVPIVPTKFSSAHQGGFRWWIRLNVNGQWEGQGISAVKVLTWKDVKDQYNYNGYHEYACVMTEYYDSEWGDFYPNHNDSITRCRFRVGQHSDHVLVPEKILRGSVDDAWLYWGPNYDYPVITGATRPPDINYAPLARAGIAYGGWNRDNYGDNLPNYDLDKINSYNERNELIAGKDRPLRGFRRFRVYFDSNNLPPANTSDQLASYAVVGMNAWNGDYESYEPNNLDKSILTAKDLSFSPDPDNPNKKATIFSPSTTSWLGEGDIFENIPGVWNHHPAGFGQGFGGLVKTQKFFDVHLGRMVDDSYLNEGFFGVVSSNDYAIADQEALIPNISSQDDTLHKAVYSTNRFVTISTNQGGDGVISYSS